MHNNLNTIITIFSTIYLLLLVLFPSVPLYWHHESWVHKNRKFVHDTSKSGSTSNRHFSMTIRPLRTIFSLRKFYTSALNVLYLLIGPIKVSTIHEDIIFASPKFACFECDISANKSLS